MVVLYENNKVIINLSNTESVGSSIFNYADLQKTKLSSISSTSSYFLSTNFDLSKKVLNYLDCDNSKFIVDIKKTRNYITQLEKILIEYNNSDFHGELKDYYNNKNYYFENTSDFEIGFAKASIEEGSSGRSYLRFNNENENIKLFRNIIIAIFSSLIIEKRNNNNYIYPSIKKEIINKMHESIKREFERYMLDVKRLNENSVSQYLDVIDYTSEDAINDGILDKSIYEYFNPFDVRSILERLKTNDHFNEITFRRNHINTAAIGNYINFLEYRKNQSSTLIKEEQDDKNIGVLENNDLKSIEVKIVELINKLKITNNSNEQSHIIKEMIRNCYEMLNHIR